MKKKTFLVLLSCFLCQSGFAQLQTTVNANNNNLGALATYGPDGANIGASSTVINPPEQIDGSLHLFESWNNKGVFKTKEGKQLLIRNINFNVDLNTFESEISKDTVFTFSFDNIERVFVNSREFKAVFKPATGLYKVYEVIFSNTDFSILKEYYIEIKKGSSNPMINRRSKYVTQSEYYLEEGKRLSKFKLKKKNILKLVGDKAGEMLAFAKENRLSFKNELDVNRMLNYFTD